jgi:hypothetical protein
VRISHLSHTYILRYPQPVTSHRERGQVPDPYKTTGKMIVLHILISTVLEGDMRTENSELN